MSTSLCVLILEDRPADAELMVLELQAGGFDPDWRRVETEADYCAGLDQSPLPDVILSDYRLPEFDGLRALQLLQQRGLDIPFILVSGAIGEDVAVEAMKQGAADYLLKDRLARLGPAVMNALEQKRLNREKHRADQLLWESEKRFRALIENSADAIALVDAEGTIVYESPSVTRSFGYSVDELVGHHAFELLHPDDLPDVAALFDKLLRAPGASVTVCVRYRRKDGAWRWVEGTATNLLAEPGIRAIVINYRDITERKQAEEKLQYLSLHDALTGLYNRAYFEEEMARLERGRQTPVSVIMVDLDDLKEINDNRGHAVGDELLRQAAAVLTAVFRAEDVITRLGGDEFAVLLPGAEAAAAQQAVERLRNHLADYNSTHNGPPLILSLGAATAEGGQSLADALKRADEGMYREKARVTRRTTGPLARQGGSP